MAHNFSNLGKIHSCPNCIAWYYWIIKHNYLLKLEWGFPCPLPCSPSCLHRQWQREGEPVFCLGPGPHCSFPSRLYNWPLQTEVNFPLWISYQSSMSPGGWNQRRNCFQVPPGLLPWLWGRPQRGRSRSKGFGRAQTGFELSCLLARFPGTGGLISRLQFALL